MKNFLKSRFIAVAGVVACLVMAGIAYGLTTFDPATGVGFVGKGDVQTPWGWNNQKLQTEASNVKFSYEEITDTAYSITCEFDTGTRHVVHHVVTHSGNVNSLVAYDAKSKSRTNPQGNVTGFILTGINPLTVVTDDEGSIPAVGDSCLGDPLLGVVTAVDLDVENSSASSTLYASDAPAGTGPTAVWINGVSVQQPAL